MKGFKILLLVVVGMVALSRLAFCEPSPLFDKSRASLAVGADYAFYQKTGSQPLPSFKKEFEVGIYGAYNLVPKLSLVSSAQLGVDNLLVKWKLGARYVIFRGKP